jgi:hypothetical protein
LVASGKSSQVKSILPNIQKHKAKIKYARAAGAGKIPELLRTEVQLGRGNHHPTARCAWSLSKHVAAPWALKCLKIRSLGRVFSSVSDSHASVRFQGELSKQENHVRGCGDGAPGFCGSESSFLLGCWSGVSPPNHVSDARWQARWSPVSSSMAPPGQVARVIDPCSHSR